MKNVISCSRRTDIPGCHYAWLQETLEIGSLVLKNPFSTGSSRISLRKEDVHSIVLWSKDFQKVIASPGALAGHNLYFQFTVNGYAKILEPNIPSLADLCDQMQSLCEIYSPEQVMWRFDPIIISEEAESGVYGTNSRLELFEILCEKFSKHGLSECTISFVDMYAKVEASFFLEGFEHQVLSTEERIEYARKMVAIAGKHGIKINTCSEPLIEKVEGIQHGRCVDGDRLVRLFGDGASVRKDITQRVACGCTDSYDIGQYSFGCAHQCLYCYARN
jgi:hypothetical protein